MAGLRRELGLLEATTITVGSMIGSGIFFTPNLVAREFPDGRIILALWVLGGLFSIAGALCVAELASMFPRSGGLYHFIREAFGDGPAFFSGWGFFLLAKAAIGAAVAYVFALHVAYFYDLTELGGKLIAAWALVSLTFVNYVGVRLTGQVQNVLTILKAAALATIIAAAALLSTSSGAGAAAPSSFQGGNLATAFAAVLFAYNAWINATFVAGEVRDPERTLPRALTIGVLIVIALYVGANAAYLHVLGPGGMAGSDLVATDTANRLFHAGGAFVAGAVVVSSYGNMNGGMLTGARLPFAMAEQGWLPRVLASVSRAGTPTGSLLLQLVAGLVILASGGFSRIITYSVFVIWGTLLLVALSLFRLRRTRPGAPRPYRVWGYPLTPAVFAAAAAFIVLQTVVQRPVEALYGVAIVATGVPLYFWGRKLEGGSRR